MNNREQIRSLPKTQFQQTFGVKRGTFYQIYKTLRREYRKLHAKSGKPPTLSVLDKLIITCNIGVNTGLIAIWRSTMV